MGHRHQHKRHKPNRRKILWGGAITKATGVDTKDTVAKLIATLEKKISDAAAVLQQKRDAYHTRKAAYEANKTKEEYYAILADYKEINTLAETLDTMKSNLEDLKKNENNLTPETITKYIQDVKEDFWKTKEGIALTAVLSALGLYLSGSGAYAYVNGFKVVWDKTIAFLSDKIAENLQAGKTLLIQVFDSTTDKLVDLYNEYILNDPYGEAKTQSIRIQKEITKNSQLLEIASFEDIVNTPIKLINSGTKVFLDAKFSEPGTEGKVFRDQLAERLSPNDSSLAKAISDSFESPNGVSQAMEFLEGAKIYGGMNIKYWPDYKESLKDITGITYTDERGWWRTILDYMGQDSYNLPENPHPNVLFSSNPNAQAPVTNGKGLIDDLKPTNNRPVPETLSIVSAPIELKDIITGYANSLTGSDNEKRLKWNAIVRTLAARYPEIEYKTSGSDNDYLKGLVNAIDHNLSREWIPPVVIDEKAISEGERINALGIYYDKNINSNSGEDPPKPTEEMLDQIIMDNREKVKKNSEYMIRRLQYTDPKKYSEYLSTYQKMRDGYWVELKGGDVFRKAINSMIGDAGGAGKFMSYLFTAVNIFAVTSIFLGIASPVAQAAAFGALMLAQSVGQPELNRVLYNAIQEDKKKNPQLYNKGSGDA